DLTICDYDAPTPLAPRNLGGHLAFGMGSASVNSVMVEGRMVYQDREFAFDVAPIYEQASKVASRLWQRMDQLA
ncbi:MAG: putative aminohydrolase SsnA, partial [Aeromonas veronii]